MADIVAYMEAFLLKKMKMDDMDRLGIVTPGSYYHEFMELRDMTARYKTEGTYKTSDGEKPANVVKNRYKDIMPYDHRRVMLKVNSESKRTDYINASEIDGAVMGQTYIAAQGPLPGTVTDFWEMIWQYNVKVVVMACNEIESGKLRCKRYWPLDTKEELKFGDISVTLTEEMDTKFKEYRVRYLRAVGPAPGGGGGEQEERSIVHLHYTAWPDRGVPKCAESLWDMIETLRHHQPLNSTANHRDKKCDSPPPGSPGGERIGGGLPPVVVHCSAGCGRTGTILVLDYINTQLKFGKLNEKFSLYDIISNMRTQRMAIVQSQEQYVFVHEAVADLFNRQLALINGHLYENIASSEPQRSPARTSSVTHRIVSLPQPPCNGGSIGTRGGSLKKTKVLASPPPFCNNLIDFSPEYRSPPSAPLSGPYTEPHDSRLGDQNRKPMKIQGIWSEPVRQPSVQADMDQPYAEVRPGAGSTTNRSSASDMRGENTNCQRTASHRSSSGASADSKSVTDSGYYSYANPDANNKWSLQAVARGDVDPSELGYASADINATRTNKPSNRAIEAGNSLEDESFSPAIPDRNYNQPAAATEDGKFSGMLNKFTTKIIGALTKTNEPPLQQQQQHQPAAVSVRLPIPNSSSSSSSSYSSSYQPEKVVYHGKLISFPNRIGKPKGKRALVENHSSNVL